MHLSSKLLKRKRFTLKSFGNSMYPILQSGDILYYKNTRGNDICTNDIVMVRKGGRVLTHRLIYKKNKTIITKGDNNLISDGKIYPRNIIAKANKIKRNGQIFDFESLYLLQSTFYFQEIVKITNAFKKGKVNFVILKGLPLHLYYENNHPRRLYLDCDVLISKKEFSRGEIILLKEGYKKYESSLSSTQKKLKNKKTEISYYKIINGYPVVFDLHSETVFMMTQLGKLNVLYPQKFIDQLTDEFLKTKKEVVIQNEKFSILNSEFLILYLALHFFHHNFHGAFRLEFLDKVIRTSMLNRESFNRLSLTIIKYRLQNFVYPVFLLLKKHYHTPLSTSFFRSIQPANHKIMKHVLAINIFDDEARVIAGISRFKLLFLLSPRPIWIKSLVFINPQVIYSIFWVIRRRLFSFFSNRQKVL